MKTSRNCCDSSIYFLVTQTTTHIKALRYEKFLTGESQHTATMLPWWVKTLQWLHVLQGSILSTMKTVFLTYEQATVDVYITHYVMHGK